MPLRRRAIAAVTAVAATVLVPLVTSATAHADDCGGTWSIGIGGFEISLAHGTGDPSDYLAVDQPVGYNTLAPMEGYNELNRLFWQHRNACPDDHVKLIGHSEGAGILHAWVTAHQNIENANAILLSDPKRIAGPGNAGLANSPLAPIVGYPLAGVDANFGEFPVLEVCNYNDVICNDTGHWLGYASGAHGRYSYDANSYGDNESGDWYR